MTIRNFFATPIVQKKLAVATKFNQELLNECYAFREIDHAGMRWSARNYAAGYTSYSSISDLHRRSPRFAALRSKIDREVGQFARHLEMDLQGGKLVMSSFWINIMGMHAHHSFHLHPLSAISGTYYVKVPRGSGCFKIEDPRIAGYMGAPPSKANAGVRNQRYVELKPATGDVLLFESWLKHEVPANLAHDDRVSVSFNYDWV